MSDFHKKRAIALAAATFALAGTLYAEEGFGFDGISEANASSTDKTASGVTVGGEVDAAVTAFADDFDSVDSAESATVGDIFSGSLAFKASGENTEAEINLDVAPAPDGDSPVSIDEAFLRAYWGQLDVEAGLRKVTWGKADSDGPLDVVNPIDYSDMTVRDNLDRRIARPLVHASWKFGSFTKLEGVFVPSFLGAQYASDGVWQPSLASDLMEDVVASVNPAYQAALAASLAGVDVSDYYPDTSGLAYTQYGLRFTTTVGSADIGFQYYYGNLATPAISVTNLTGVGDPDISIEYNRFHQIGADYASVWSSFNVRGELALNLTEDLEGDEGSIVNPFVAWSFGFDRDIFAGINLNAQASGTVRLMDDGVGDTVADTEYDTDLTNTALAAKLSKSFAKDEWEIKLDGIYEIEDADYYLIPGLVWTKGDTEVECVVGLFGGSSNGRLGQFDENDYLKLSVNYSF